MSSESENEVLSLVHKLGDDGTDFEKFLADLWEELGWETEVTSQNNDRGIDVIARRDFPLDIELHIQAKNHSNPIRGKRMREYTVLTHRESADLAAVISSSSFRPEAEREAEIANVKLINGKKLSKIIRRNNAHELLAHHVEDNRLVRDLDGIGEKSKELLNRASIYTVDDLAASDPVELNEKIEGRSKNRLERWVCHAKFREEKPVQMIPGIGEKYAEKLRKENIVVVGDLATADPEKLAEKTDISNVRLHRSIQAARELPSNSIRELDGIGKRFGQKLERVGICTIGHLAFKDSEELAEETNIDESKLNDWISQACKP